MSRPHPPLPGIQLTGALALEGLSKLTSNTSMRYSTHLIVIKSVINEACLI